MGKIQVIAKVDGVHAMTGLALVRGQVYEVEEAHAGHLIFDRADGKAWEVEEAPAGGEGTTEEDITAPAPEGAGEGGGNLNDN